MFTPSNRNTLRTSVAPVAATARAPAASWILTWIAPFASAWRARGYLLIAIVFWVLDNTVPSPFKGVTGSDRQWWHDLIDKAFGSFDKVAYAVLFAGLAYAVVSDGFSYIWSTKVETEVRDGFRATGVILRDSLSHFTSGLASMSFEAVKVWVEGGQATDIQSKSIGAASLRLHYEMKQGDDDDLVGFMLADIMDGSAYSSSQIWDNLITNVTIRNCNVPGHLEWEEQKSYTVVCRAAQGALPLLLEASFQVGNTHIDAVLKRLEYSIEFGSSFQFNLQDWMLKYGAGFASTPFKVEEENVSLEYNGIWLNLGVRYSCDIQNERTLVKVYERSLISEQDRCYAIAVRHPTKTLQATISLEGLPNWAVKPPIASASLYKAKSRIVDIQQRHKQTATVRVPHWTLPGLALVVEWTPTISSP